jgi:phosphohistidine swiveling domain-containing protein
VPADHDAVSAQETWTHDPSHYPEPMTPLSADIWFEAMGLGIQAAARELRAPFGGFDTKLADGGWAYERDLEPAWDSEPEVLQVAALRIAERWAEELRPRSEAVTEELRRLRPERYAPAEAVAALDRLVELVREQWHVHFLTVMPVHAAREVLHDAYVEHLGKAGELEPYRLIEGVPNETLEADDRLWEIAQLARRLDVADLILELPARSALDALALTHHGREVLAELTSYLRRFGGRSRLHELSVPREAERPDLVLETVRLFLEHPRDVPAQRRVMAQERAALERDVVARIDPAARAEFAELLRRVVAAVELEESHAYHLDYPGLAATREALLGFGRRLVAEGRLDRSADVFLLRRSELRAAVGDAWGEPLHPLVEQRRAELERARATQPRPFLGPPPSAGADIPPMVAKFYGVPGSASHEGDLLRGTAASTGAAVGIARVVSGEEDFSRLRAGDVLVCTTTTPAWTPVFSSIAALVTDSGGILCHAAVVAREYRLPAVVGTEVGTRVIPDGTQVRVDGSTGEVRIIRR